MKPPKPARAGLGNRDGHRAIRTRREAHHEHGPSRHLPFSSSQKSFEVRHRLSDPLFFSVTRASTSALGRAHGSLSSRRWFTSRKGVKQIVSPGIRHDCCSQGKNYQHARRPEPDDIVPVPVPGFTAQATVEYQAGLQTTPLPTSRPPEVDQKNAKLQAPVMAFPMARPSPSVPSQRCQSTISCSTLCAAEKPP